MHIHLEKIFTGIKRLAVVALALLLLVEPGSPVFAQNTGWAYPQTMPSFDLDMAPPFMIADQSGNVHAFSSQYIENLDGESVRAVVYNRWAPATGWTPPVDILLSPIYEARVTDAFLDDEGYVNLVFFGGNGIDADIYYSKAPLGEVANARSWTKPFIIGDEATDPEGAVFARTNQGKLVVVFNGKHYGNGLYVVTSDNHGSSWSFPIPIFASSDRAPNIFYMRAIKSESGWLHVIWSVYDINGQGRGVYYARSSDGASWDQPTLLVETRDGLGAQTPTIIEHQGALFAIYNLPPKIVMQRSEDNGITWQDPVIMFSRHVGVNGALAPVVDSNDTLHLFFGQRITGNPDIHGMWHSTWTDRRWAEPEALIKGPQIDDDAGLTSFDPNTTRAVLISGNVILVTWRTDPGFNANGVWYSYIQLDSNQAPLPPQPTELSANFIPTEQASNPNPIIEEPTPANSGNPAAQASTPIWSVAAYAGLIFLALFAVYYILRRRSAEG